MDESIASSREARIDALKALIAAKGNLIYSGDDELADEVSEIGQELEERLRNVESEE